MARPSVVTSIKVDEDLWKKAKKRAVDEEITLQELINSAVEAWLRSKGGTYGRRRRREN
jgi:predicted transcriptional regulator